MVTWLALSCALVLSAGKKPPEPAADTPAWLGEKMPLQLSVQSAEDLAFKAVVERQYLVFNLLAAGKLAWDKGEAATAAEKWEALLRVPGLGADIDAVVRPLALQARAKAGGEPSVPLPPPATPVAGAKDAAPKPSPGEQARRQVYEVSGVVSGGGSLGPGGAVVFLKRTEGSTPKPKPGVVRTLLQKDKRFSPRVLAVTQGSSVEFRNEDGFFHNVFSLTRPNDFDLGLYKGGSSREQKFEHPGPVQLLCNIHSSMMGWVYVVDTPWFSQADGAGRFTVKGVPAGEYLLTVWHEAASQPVVKKVRVNEALGELQVLVESDRWPPAFVPDKAGKPRQPQLGY